MTAARRIVLTGGTGLIGRAILRILKERGDLPTIITRRPDQIRADPDFAGVELIGGDPTRTGDWQRHVDGSDAVINLAGHPVFPDSIGKLLTGRWGDSTRRAIRGSRIESTHRVVEAIRSALRPPEALIQASAIGYYGAHGDEPCDESAPPGSDFLARVCADWEEAANRADSLARVAVVRIGVVLDREAGALKLLVPLFRYIPGAAAPIGNPRSDWLPASGSQWFSWIHREDIARLFVLALDRPDFHGAMNGTAPNPATHREFTKALASALHRFSLPVGPPNALLRLLIGGATDVLISGQRALPMVANRLGFSFRYPQLDQALAELVGRGSSGKSEV